MSLFIYLLFIVVCCINFYDYNSPTHIAHIHKHLLYIQWLKNDESKIYNIDIEDLEYVYSLFPNQCYTIWYYKVKHSRDIQLKFCNGQIYESYGIINEDESYIYKTSTINVLRWL